MPDLSAPPALSVGPAGADDLGAIASLLASLGLPYADLSAEHLASFWVARDGDHVVGSVGLEVFPEGGLLRSLAVHPSAQGRGLGGRLAEAVEQGARRRGLPALFLLTTTAEAYFSRRGWRLLPRAEVPPGVRGAREFAVLCPASAACLTLPLGPPPP